jgi:CheY-like chemotaxis protein
MAMATPRILLVEDNPADVLLWECAFAEACHPAVALTIVTDGDAAWGLLNASCAAGATFDLVISDQCLPRSSGAQLAARMLAEPAFHNLPIVVVSGAAPRADGPVRSG